FIFHSLALRRLVGEFPQPPFGVGLAFLMGLLAYLLLAGRLRTAALLLGGLQLATTITFNPLATNLDCLYDSELAREITRINRESSGRPFWIAYGSTHPGVLVEILGGRSLTGIQWPPQLGLWRALDAGGKNEFAYNRYAEVSLKYANDDHTLSFDNPGEGSLDVTVSPTNPKLKAVGARYVLFMGNAQSLADASRLKLISHSAFDNFSIYEIP
ncbi:MAG TPA: hypothetical protein VJZ91_16545, partial [Blastocatellia bacterium]|nr:hypothetical protein [Blastocatellia bacterium]